METYQEFIKRKDFQFQKSKLVPMRDIGRKAKHHWKREAWTFMPQHNLKEKVFIIERLRLMKVEGTSAEELFQSLADSAGVALVKDKDNPNTFVLRKAGSAPGQDF